MGASCFGMGVDEIYVGDGYTSKIETLYLDAIGLSLQLGLD